MYSFSFVDVLIKFIVISFSFRGLYSHTLRLTLTSVLVMSHQYRYEDGDFSSAPYLSAVLLC